MMRAMSFSAHGVSLVAEPLTESTGPLRVVVMHGWANSRENTRALAGQLSALGEVWALDLPGHGDAPSPAEAASPFTMALAVNAWLATLPPCPTVLVGHSMGFRVAMHMAAQKTPHLKGLVAIAGAGVPRPLSRKKKLRKRGIQWAMKLAHALKPYLGDVVLTALRHRFGSTDYLAVSAAMRPTFLAVVNDDTTALCPAITVPTLLIYGTADTETPPELGQKFQSLLPQATLHLLPHQTHQSVLEAGRHLVARHILAFALPLTGENA